MPKRIQRRRTKGWVMPDGVVYVGRPSRYGNPYRVGTTVVTLEDEIVDVKSIEQSLELYRRNMKLLIKLAWMHEKVDFLAPLRGKDLACWCALDAPCHAGILLELANAQEA